eukprot:768398-Hanusia_phi.AAC.4
MSRRGHHGVVLFLVKEFTGNINNVDLLVSDIYGQGFVKQQPLADRLSHSRARGTCSITRSPTM